MRRRTIAANGADERVQGVFVEVEELHADFRDSHGRQGEERRCPSGHPDVYLGGKLLACVTGFRDRAADCLPTVMIVELSGTAALVESDADDLHTRRGRAF
ncbi:MAG: hypothetical protein P4L84_17465 [Isosphaeraceae bacterium]|nr:hypothetical protein [Isosphaeraceae bacterium]